MKNVRIWFGKTQDYFFFFQKRKMVFVVCFKQHHFFVDKYSLNERNVVISSLEKLNL